MKAFLAHLFSFLRQSLVNIAPFNFAMYAKEPDCAGIALLDTAVNWTPSLLLKVKLRHLAHVPNGYQPLSFR